MTQEYEATKGVYSELGETYIENIKDEATSRYPKRRAI